MHETLSFQELQRLIYIVQLKQDGLKHDSILAESDGHPKDIRQSECRHDCLRKVTITGFCSSKGLVELTSHILENASSLKCLTLDTTRDHERSFATIDRCFTMSKEALTEAHRSLEAIRRYIIGKVPSNVCLKVLEPCKRCQPDNIQVNFVMSYVNCVTASATYKCLLRSSWSKNKEHFVKAMETPHAKSSNASR